MGVLIAGLMLFLGLHSVRIVADDWRSQVIFRVGTGVWKATYAVLSIVGFVMLCWGYGQARQLPIVLWVPPVATRHVAALLMLLSMVLLVAAYIPENHLKAKLHHPMLLSIKVWASAHLLANGNLADVLLFGSFLLWAVACYVAARRRDRKTTPVYPPGRKLATFATVLIGVGAYGVVVVILHALLIGVSVFG